MSAQPHWTARIEYSMLTPKIVEIRIAGEIGLGSVPSLERLIRQILEAGQHRIVFNLKETQYIASAGIGCLIGAAELAKERGGGVVIAAVREKVGHVLKIMGMDRLIQFTADSAEAAALLGSTP